MRSVSALLDTIVMDTCNQELGLCIGYHDPILLTLIIQYINYKVMNETGIFMNFLPNIVYNMQGKGF